MVISGGARLPNGPNIFAEPLMFKYPTARLHLVTRRAVAQRVTPARRICLSNTRLAVPSIALPSETKGASGASPHQFLPIPNIQLGSNRFRDLLKNDVLIRNQPIA
jgi:hypothetical protein